MAYYLSESDLANNPSTRVPVCLCLDLSGSMDAVESGSYQETGRQEMIDGKLYNIVTGGVTRLNELQKGIELLFQAIREDETAVDSAEIAIVGFSDKAECILDFGHIEDQKIPHLEANGSTAMGEGVNLALKLLEERKSVYKRNGIQYYQPWLVLMTDGANNGNTVTLKKAIDKTCDLVNNGKLTIFPIGIGKDADMRTLKMFSPKRDPLRLKGLKFQEFFSWLSQSISKTSVSNPGDKVTLDPPTGWGEL